MRKSVGSPTSLVQKIGFQKERFWSLVPDIERKTVHLTDLSNETTCESLDDQFRGWMVTGFEYRDYEKSAVGYHLFLMLPGLKLVPVS